MVKMAYNKNAARGGAGNRAAGNSLSLSLSLSRVGHKIKQHCSTGDIYAFFASAAFLLSLGVGVAQSGVAEALEYQSEPSVQFTFNPTISVNLSGDLVIEELAPGNYADSNVITVGVNTNAAYGYTLMATAGTKAGNTTALVNTSDSNAKFTSIGTGTTVATLAGFTDNYWGYSYSTDSGSSWISGSQGSTSAGYSGLPLDANDSASERGNGGVTLIDAEGASGDAGSVQFKIGAKASAAQASGEYTNTINFYAVTKAAPDPNACPAGEICYRSNADVVAGVMENQSVGTSATSAMLMAYNYKRAGHAFLGWSTVANPTIGTDTIYGPMEDITFDALVNEGLNLYAVWLPKSTTYTMQNFSSITCSSQLTQITYNSSDTSFTVFPNSFIALEDTRDGDVYTVARLSDGNCWMLENLRLDETATNVTTQSQGVDGSFTTLAASEDSNFSNSTTANSLYSTGNAYTMPRYNRNNTYIDGTNSAGTKLTPSYNGNNNSSQWYGYGNYYSWAAAKANTTAMTSASASNNTATSICPTNWRLPIGNSTATYSFGALSTSMGGASATMNTSSTPTGAVMSARLRHFPNNFVYSGYWSSARAYGRSASGYYWSSTAINSNYAYYLYFYSSGVDPGTVSRYKYFGSSVRCVAGS